MHLTTKIASLVAAAIAVALIGATVTARNAYADDLPYKAFGSGLKAGQSVEAFAKGVSVAKATVDTAGNWVMEIAATKASNGDKVTFAIDGKAAKESVTFTSGQFTPVPGVALTLAPEGTPLPTPAATPAVAAPQTGPGTFAAPPVFSTSGVAQVVYNGGSAEQLLKAATGGGAKTAWAQAPDGKYVALIPGAPDFVNEAFYAAFKSGFAATSIVLVK